MTGAKEFVLVCLVFLVISCLTSAQPVAPETKLDVYDQFHNKDHPKPIVPSSNLTPRSSRSVKYSPYLDKFMEKVNQKAIRSPSLRLRFGRRSDPDFPPNYDLLNEEFQQEPVNQQLLSAAFPSSRQMSSSLSLPSRYFGFAREERKPARLRWGRSAPGQFSNARDQVMDTMDAMARDQRSKTSRLRWGRSGPMSYSNEFKDYTDNELATLAIQYLINKQQLEDEESRNEPQLQANPDTESNGKN